MLRFDRKCAVCAVCVVCVALLAGGCERKKSKKAESRAVRVSVQHLEKRVFKRQIPVQGNVEPVDYAVISAKVGGTLESLDVAAGDVLKKDDILFGIDRQVLKNQVTMREDEIKVKQAGVAMAKAARDSVMLSEQKAVHDYERARKLFKSKAISQSDFEEAETDFKKAKTDTLSAVAAVANAEAQLKQAESNLVIARKNLDDSVQRAPYNSVVVDTYIKENEYVSGGQEILKLESHDKLNVVCYISAVYYDAVREQSTPVEFYLHGKKLGDGVITYKAPSIDPASRTFKIKAAVPEKVRLVSGDLCNLNIILEAKTAYGLPSDAILLRANNRYIVYALGGNNIAESFDVTPGIIDSGFTEIVNAGELDDKKFVVVGQNFVNSGALLQVINGN